MQDQQDLWSRERVAQYLGGIHVKTVDRIVARRVPPAQYAGRKPLWKPEDVMNAFLEGRFNLRQQRVNRPETRVES